MVNQITKRAYGITDLGQEVIEYTLSNLKGLVMKVINYGCTITSLMIPDRNDIYEDVVLGFDRLEGYLQSDQSIGCVVGRFANRIANGKFSIEGREFQLDINTPPHHLHGGTKGFGRVVWDAAEIKNENGSGILFSHLSPDGHEGYPGNLHINVLYFLSKDNTLSFEYSASTDQDTIINFTQHSYFNLNGGKENILDHELSIHADYLIPVDNKMIPTGEILSVTGTPFDFRTPKTIGRDIDHDDTQLSIGHGYDHCWMLQPSGKELRTAATLYDKKSGRYLEVLTTEPGIQVYTANFLKEAVPGKNNVSLAPRLGVCLETQHFPDSPNHPDFPSTLLAKGDTYSSKTLLAFSIR